MKNTIRQKTILTVTMNPSIDARLTVDEVVPKKKLRGRDFKREAGGGGVNVSRAIQRLGGESLAFIALGGRMGNRLEELLDEEGIAMHCFTIADETRENFIVNEAQSDQQYRFGVPGPELSDAEWQQALAWISQQSPDFLVLSGSLPQGSTNDFYARVLEAFSERATRVIVDSSMDSLRHALEVGGIHLIKPNVYELAQLAERPLGNDETRIDYARELIDKGCVEIVAITLGAEGTYFVSKDVVLKLCPPSVAVKSAVGAGDSMIGAYILKLAQGASRDEAFRYSVAASTSAVTTPGTELCRLDDTNRFMEQVTEVPIIPLKSTVG